MRHLIPGVMQNLFADELSDNQTFRLVSYHVLRVILWSLRQILLYLIYQALKVCFLLSRYRNYSLEVVFFIVAGDNRQHSFLFHQVQLIYNKNYRTLSSLKPFQDIALTWAILFSGIYNKQDGIYLLQGSLGSLNHIFA